MSRRKNQFKRGSSASFVKMDSWVMKSEAWRCLKPGPRALYLVLKMRFNGHNNGEIFLSHRDAADELNVTRSTIAGHFRSLVQAGFLVVTRGHSLGPSGRGFATHYALTELPHNAQPATKDFMSRKTEPRTKNHATPAQKLGQLPAEALHNPGGWPKNHATLTPICPERWPSFQAISTSSHGHTSFSGEVIEFVGGLIPPKASPKRLKNEVSIFLTPSDQPISDRRAANG